MTGKPQEIAAVADDQKESLARRLIDAWCAAHGGQIPWDKAVQIVAIVTGMPESERDRLLMLGSTSDGDIATTGDSAHPMAVLIAAELARIDGYNVEDSECGLYDMRWSGGPTPEPEGAEWDTVYLPKGQRVARAIAAASAQLPDATEPESVASLQADRVFADDEAKLLAEHNALMRDVIHGFNCQKVVHDPSGRYSHDASDDSLYSSGGAFYCGRCHHILAAV